jgi:hypothetical protein
MKGKSMKPGAAMNMNHVGMTNMNNNGFNQSKYISGNVSHHN